MKSTTLGPHREATSSLTPITSPFFDRRDRAPARRASRRSPASARSTCVSASTISVGLAETMYSAESCG